MNEYFQRHVYNEVLSVDTWKNILTPAQREHLMVSLCLFSSFFSTNIWWFMSAPQHIIRWNLNEILIVGFIVISKWAQQEPWKSHSWDPVIVISQTSWIEHTCSLNRKFLLLENKNKDTYQEKWMEIHKCGYCVSAKHRYLSGQSDNWLARSQNSVPEWGKMLTCRLLPLWTSTIKIQLSTSD